MTKTRTQMEAEDDNVPSKRRESFAYDDFDIDFPHLSPPFFAHFRQRRRHSAVFALLAAAC